MIKLEEVSKTFQTDSGRVNAVENITLEIQSGEIYGVIGHSGAGKSTLVRCINLLERPDKGNVIIKGEDITTLSEAELRKRRHSIGMIFQQFHLLSARTVYENVAFPLRYQKVDKQLIDQRVRELLEIVGLQDKAEVYPSQLSGGQKQRVAIARALANDPDILLCDEATSALDPQTTESILKLLKRLNQQLGLTIVLITHEMHVVKSICHRVAVMQAGRIVEEGSVLDVFVRPQKAITKEFIQPISNISKVYPLVEENAAIVSLEANQQLLRLDFYGNHTKEAIIYEITTQFNVKASIIFADVDIIQETIIGSVVIILEGDTLQKKLAIEYLKTQSIQVEVIKDGCNH